MALWPVQRAIQLKKSTEPGSRQGRGVWRSEFSPLYLFAKIFCKTLPIAKIFCKCLPYQHQANLPLKIFR